MTDIHESGAGVGRTEDGFIVMVDGILPDARARVKILRVMSNHARAEEIERLPMEEADEEESKDDTPDRKRGRDRPDRPERLGSRDNFWGS